MDRQKPSDMSCEYIDAKPREIDWSGIGASDDGEPGFESYEAVRCEACDAAVVLRMGDGGDQHDRVALNDHDSECDCAGHVPTAEGPAMNYFYPCDWERYSGGRDDAATRIAHLPLVLIEMADGEKGLALSGGGQDLSWEICEAFMLLGYLPPRHFSGDLPLMQSYSMDEIERRRWVVTGARRAGSVFRAWLASDGRKIKAATARLDESEKDFHKRERAMKRAGFKGKAGRATARE